MFAAFNSINSFISRLDSESPSQHRLNPDTCGFRVLRNVDSDLKVDPWFDFIVGINGRQIVCLPMNEPKLMKQTDPNAALLSQEIQNSTAVLTLTIFSAKGGTYREISVPSPRLPLGLTLQYCPFSLAQDIYHVLSITPNSPADEAGLLPYSDYIIGSPDGRLRGEDGLAELVDSWLDRKLTLWVYNHEFDVTREIGITPSRRWGGEGALGCTLGYGALHRIPAPLTEGPAPERGETFFDSEKFGFDPSDEDFLVPASDFQTAAPAVSQPTPPPPSASPATLAAAHTPARSKAKKGKTTNRKLDAYFEEGEAQSREIDHAPVAKTGIAPPPKGPPKG